MKTKFAIAAIVATQILLVSAQAEENVYLSASTEMTSTIKTDIFGGQPLGEIVGQNGLKNVVKLGLDMKDFRVYSYLWNNSNKNNEMGLGIGAEFIFGEILVPELKYRVGGSAGYGWQSVKGKTASTSTNMTKVSFITGGTSTGPTTITYTDDTAVIQIALDLGVTYQVSRNWSIDGGYVYTSNAYQFSYRNNDNPSVLNALTSNQNDHAVKFGLNYIF
jgi:hypothetical protein